MIDRRLAVSALLVMLANSAWAGVATLTQAEAYVDAFSFTGSGANSVEIDERIEWDGVGSTFMAEIDAAENFVLFDNMVSVVVDNTIAARVEQRTQIQGELGGDFRGFRSRGSAPRPSHQAAAQRRGGEQLRRQRPGPRLHRHGRVIPPQK